MEKILVNSEKCTTHYSLHLQQLFITKHTFDLRTIVTF